MFDIGFSELVVIGLIALIILGPKRLPEVARTAGRWMGQLRRFVSDVKRDLDREMHAEDLSELRKLKEELSATRRLMENTSGELIKGFTEITPDPASTIHSPETPALPESGPESAAPRGKRPKRRKSSAGKKHGANREL